MEKYALQKQIRKGAWKETYEHMQKILLEEWTQEFKPSQFV